MCEGVGGRVIGASMFGVVCEIEKDCRVLKGPGRKRHVQEFALSCLRGARGLRLRSHPVSGWSRLVHPPAPEAAGKLCPVRRGEADPARGALPGSENRADWAEGSMAAGGSAAVAVFAMRPDH